MYRKLISAILFFTLFFYLVPEIAYAEIIDAEITTKARVLITFDDGISSVYSDAFPYMNQKGIRGTAYVNRNFTNTFGYMNENQLQELYANGWDIANHTYSHQNLIILTNSEVEFELKGNTDWLNNMGFYRSSRHVAYPFGSQNTSVVETMSKLGIKTGRTVSGSLETAPPSDKYRIPAYSIHNTTTLEEAKSYVDSAVNNGKTVILNFHRIVAAPQSSTEWSIVNFQGLIDYIVSKGVKSETIDQWYKEFVDPTVDQPVPYTPPASQEELLNNDFNGNGGWAGINSAIKTETNGNRYISNGYNWKVYQEIPVTPNSYYLINAGTRKGTATTSARLVYTLTDTQGQSTSGNIFYYHNRNDWENMPEALVTIPDNVTKLRLTVTLNGGTGYHDYDNFSVKKFIPSPLPEGEMLYNGDISGSGGWSTLAAKTEENGNRYISNGYNWNVYQDITVIPGATYLLNAQTRKGTATTKARLSYSYIDNLGNKTRNNVYYSHIGSGWESMPESLITVPANVSKLRLYLTLDGGTGYHDYDNISVKKFTPPVLPPGEQIVNGDFTGSGGWSALAVKTDTDGNRYVSNGYNWSVYQDITVTPGSTYLLNALTRKGTATTSARLMYTFIDNEGKTTSNNVFYKHLGTQWENIPESLITIPSNVSKLRLYLTLNGGTGYHDYDNISLKKI